MDDILSKEPVQRVISALSDFDKSLKVEVLNSSAKTAKEAATSLNCEVGAIVKSTFKNRRKFYFMFSCW